MRLYNKQSETFENIPEDKVQASINSGQFAIEQDKANMPVQVVSTSGERGTIPLKDAFKAFASGFKYVTEEQQQEERLEKEYSDFEDEVSATALGFVRGATFGLSDQVLAKTGLISKETLNYLKKYNPKSSTTGEVLGVLAPQLLSRGQGPIGTGARATGKMTLGASKISQTIGRRVAPSAMKGLNKITKNVLSRPSQAIAKKAIETGLGSAVEGAMYGAGQLISEEALGNAEFNAESIFSALKTGAVYGGTIGAGTTLGIGTGKRITKAMSRQISKAKEKSLRLLDDWSHGADDSIFRLSGAQKTHFKNINLKDKRVPGYKKQLANYGRTIIRKTSDELEDSLKNATDDLQKEFLKGESVKFQKSGIRATTEDIFQNNKANQQASIKMMNHALEESDKIYDELSNLGKLPNEKLVTGKKLADWYRKKFVPKKPLPGTSQQVEKMANFADEIESFGATFNEVTGQYTFPKSLKPSELRNFRKHIDDLVGNWEKDTSGVAQSYVKSLKELRNHMEQSLDDLMLDGIITSKKGRDLAKVYKDGKKIYSLSKDFEKMLDNQLAREMTNNGISLTGYISAGAGAAAAGPIGAVAGLLTRKASQKYGDNLVAYILSNVERDQGRSIRSIHKGISNFFKKSKSTIPATIIREKVSEQEEYKRSKQEYKEYMEDLDNFFDNMTSNNAALMQAAPQIGTNLMQKTVNAVNFLNSKIKDAGFSGFAGVEYSPSETQIREFMDYKKYVDNPMTLFKEMEDGYVSPKGIETLKIVYPKMYELTQELALEYLSQKDVKMPYNRRQQLSRLLDLKTDYINEPQSSIFLQALISGQTEQQKQQESIRGNNIREPGADKAKIASNMQTGLNRSLNRA